MPTPALPLTPPLSARLSGTPLVLFLDIDGTLSPIAPRPEYAIVPPRTQAMLDELARLRGVHVVVVTGRGAGDGRRMVCTDRVWVIGNHGFEIAQPGGQPSPRADVARFAPSIAQAYEAACTVAADPTRQGVIVENKQWTLSVHYRLAHPRIVPELTGEIERIAADAGLRVTHGKEVLELRPPLAIDKGSAAVDLAESLGAMHDGASLFAAGDDRTDEDMFRALRTHQPRTVTLRVGADLPGVGAGAEFSVADTDAMYDLLSAIAALRRG
jgi:trehalose-phosphatase